MPSCRCRRAGPSAEQGSDTAPAGFRAAVHLADGAYCIDLSWLPPRVDGVVAEYQIQLDGQSATSLVWGGNPPAGRAAYSFYAGREDEFYAGREDEAGARRHVQLRARLPDGTWGGFSAERTVTTGARR